ncbi:hypothetical protein [Streptomyces exfoliatus]|uniref:hypothetical protein n=1 Tax=Streptomyces exfoliatus TaxID=1905 RepID=UPI0004C9A8A7|nr:hypothetical protein [Streptomyces exfoliatus]
MFLFLIVLSSAIALIVIGAVVDGALYLLSTGVLLLVVAVLYLLVRSILRTRRGRPTTVGR